MSCAYWLFLYLVKHLFEYFPYYLLWFAFLILSCKSYLFILDMSSLFTIYNYLYIIYICDIYWALLWAPIMEKPGSGDEMCGQKSEKKNHSGHRNQEEEPLWATECVTMPEQKEPGRGNLYFVYESTKGSGSHKIYSWMRQF